MAPQKPRPAPRHPARASRGRDHPNLRQFAPRAATDNALAPGELLAVRPEVQGGHPFAGENGYLVKAHVASTEALGHLLRERFGAIPTICSTRTIIVLSTSKERATRPIVGEGEHTHGDE